MTIAKDEETIRRVTASWLEDIVIGLNLCPFARPEWEAGRVRVFVSDAKTESALAEALVKEMSHLLNHDKVETTLLVHPAVLTEFEEYNQFLDQVDYLVSELDLEGVLQVATFHPDYQFFGTEPDALDNFTNRSPYPMLHLLREDSLEAAIERHPDPQGIPKKNISRLNDIGLDSVQALLSACGTHDAVTGKPE